MVAWPAATWVTRPDVLTVATLSFRLVQLNVAPAIGLALASSAVAEKLCVALPVVSCTAPGVTVTVAANCWTVTSAVPERPAISAVIVTMPLAIAVTSPLTSISAIKASVVFQPKMFPLATTVPTLSCTSALICSMLPRASMVLGLGVTTTVAPRLPSRTVPLVPTARIPGLGSPKTPERFSVVPLTSAVQPVPSYWMIVPATPTAMTSLDDVPHTDRRNSVVTNGSVISDQFAPS